MTGKDRRNRKPNVTASSEPRNTGGMKHVEIRLDSIEVATWHPLPDGRGGPTQVHLSMMAGGLDMPMVMRFKGPGTLDALISALAVHRYNVWPDRDSTGEEFAGR